MKRIPPRITAHAATFCGTAALGCVSRRSRCTRDGWILVEVTLSISLLAMLIVGLGVAQNTFGRLNHYELVQQHCVAAATAQIHQFLATGHEIAPSEARRLWPDVRVTLQLSPGQGSWAGLTQIQAVATGSLDRIQMTAPSRQRGLEGGATANAPESRGKEVRVELRRYAPAREPSP